MKLILVKGDISLQKPICEMLEEWSDYNATHQTNRSPWAIFKKDWKDFQSYLDNLEIPKETPTRVPDSIFFCFDESRNKMVGAINIRHKLNQQLLLNGGHIGYGVRPSERGKGIATQMLALALCECKKLNIPKVLLVCDKTNIASSKCIQNNGGVLENEIIVDGKNEMRYWITIE